MKRFALALAIALTTVWLGVAYGQFGPGAGQTGIGGCGPQVGGGPQAGGCGAPGIPGSGGGGAPVGCLGTSLAFTTPCNSMYVSVIH